MSITFKMLMIAIIGFIVVNSILTVIFGTISWLIDKYGGKSWAVLGLLGAIIVYILYINFGDMVGELLTAIQ